MWEAHTHSAPVAAFPTGKRSGIRGFFLGNGVANRAIKWTRKGLPRPLQLKRKAKGSFKFARNPRVGMSLGAAGMGGGG